MRFFVILLAVFIGIGLAGCRKRSVPPPQPPPKVEQSEKNTAANVPIIPDAAPILARMVTAYQSTIFYEDKATVQIIGTMTQPHTKPAPKNCNVVFQKPNQIRLTISDGIYVSHGKDCYATIRSLPDQILHRSVPENLTLETLFQDVCLDHAMSLGVPPSVLRFPPQLILLFANNPLNTFCPKGAKVEWLEQQSLGQVPCDVIRISHSDGNRLLWISQENSALLRLDYQPVGLPVPEGFDSIESIRIEMTEAQFNGTASNDTFQPPSFTSASTSDAAVQVAEFKADIPGLPTPEEHRQQLKQMTESDIFRFIDQQIESVIPLEQVPPKTAPKTFTLSSLWKQPLVGGSTFALLPGTEPKLLVPCEGNLVTVLNLQGKALQKNSPKGLENSIITDIQISPVSAGKQRIGIRTFDGKLSFFDESFAPLSAAEQNSITVQSADTPTLDSVEIPFGRHVLWFHLLDSTFYTLLEDPNTGDVRFAGLNRSGKGLWSRLLPAGEYEIEPVFVPKERKWLVSLPNGEIMVFDLQGNVLDTFSLNMVPTGLFCAEIRGVIYLFITDGETVTAWKVE